jgi:hypothetical protein
MKTCKECCKTKPDSEFPTYSANGKRGLRGKCRTCWNIAWSPVVTAHSNRYYHENRNGYRDKAKARTRRAHHAPGAHIIHQQRNMAYAMKHPERMAAKVAVMMAVRAGRLIPEPCRICGGKAQAHHDDYSKPLDVIWLCPIHHGERHRLVRRYGNPSEWPDDLRDVRQMPEAPR